MSRSVVLSNGQLFVGIDNRGLVHDFYYPYVGLDNLTNARNSQHKIGVWVDGRFSWVGDSSWNIAVNFESDALISNITMQCDSLQVRLDTNDFVDPDINALIRRITVTNLAEETRDIRVFMHQVFQISRAGRADTALFVPDDNYILDYKGRCCLLVAGRLAGDGDFDQFAVGNYAIEGKAGTFVDAEDGELSGNAVEHGGVDSVIRFRPEPTHGNANFTVDYWVVAADSQSDAQVIHTKIKYYSVSARLDNARKYWHKWLEPARDRLAALDENIRIEAQKSLLVIKAHCDARGSVLASGDSDIFNYGRDYYCYCWPRDASFALQPLIRLGLYDEARRFFEFARDTRHRDGYLMHKYQPDRAIGSTWHPLLHGKHKELAIQEDETAIVVAMISEYYTVSRDIAFVESFYSTFIEPCASFMANFIDAGTGLPHASYDLWEQKFLTSTYTVCSVICGLEGAALLAEAAGYPDDQIRWKKAAESIRENLAGLVHPDGYFRKGYLLQESGNLAFDDTIDISNLMGPVLFSNLSPDNHTTSTTAQMVEDQLLNTSPIGGVIRYPGDGYFLEKGQYPGNPWHVCTLWLARYYISIGNLEAAQQLLNWSVARQTQSGILSEQCDPENGNTISVAPLVWSHAEFLNTVLDMQEKANQ